MKEYFKEEKIESKKYGYVRDADAKMGLGWRRTGNLLRDLCDPTIQKEYKRLVKGELRKRKFTDIELEKKIHVCG